MKIERISENKIRCTLNRSDLSARQLTLRELAYGTEKARMLFREMIQRATAEVGFEVEDIPLMIEAIPLASEGIMLIITKIDDPEELDTRFAKFTPSDRWEPVASEEDEEELDLSFPSGVGDVLDALNRYTESSRQEPSIFTRCFRFSRLEQVIEAAHALRGQKLGDNALYKSGDGTYYLTLTCAGHRAMEFNSICNLLSEYGSLTRSTAGLELYYREHYEPLVPERALESLAEV